jgi:hypothetical protein
MDIQHRFWALHVLHYYELHNTSHSRNNPMGIRRQFSQLLAVAKLTQVQQMRIHMSSLI